MCYVKRTHFRLLGLPSNYERQIRCLLMSAEGRGSCTIMKMEVLENGPSFSVFVHPSLLPAFPWLWPELDHSNASSLFSGAQKAARQFALGRSTGHHSVAPHSRSAMIWVRNSTPCPCSKEIHHLLFKDRHMRSTELCPFVKQFAVMQIRCLAKQSQKSFQ